MQSGKDQFARVVLSRYAPVAPVRWRFCNSVNGKPVVVDPPRPLSFNLSSSGDWQACVVSPMGSVGVDLEYCDPRRDVMKLARRFFREPEVAALQACTDRERTVPGL